MQRSSSSQGDGAGKCTALMPSEGQDQDKKLGYTKCKNVDVGSVENDAGDESIEK